MQLLLDKNLIGLDEKELPNSHMGKLLANALISSSGGDAIKYMDWSLKLYSGQSIELDDADYNKLYKEVENNKQFTRLVSAQILKEMDKQKQTKTKTN